MAQTSLKDMSFLKAPEKQHFANPPQILIIGAGSRGTSYARAALSCSNAVVAAVCEPIESKRLRFGRKFIWGDAGAPPYGACWKDWKAWVAYEKERRECERSGKELPGVNGSKAIKIDAVFVCVLDEMHEEVVCGIAELGVHICVEKPLSTRLGSCMNIYRALKEARSLNETETHVNGKQNGAPQRKDPIFSICHVLRYSPHNMMLRHLLLERNVIGDILSIEHVEPVGWWHFSHSYVRGNWRKESKTAPSLLTKSCHDIDFLLWLLCSPLPNTAPETPPHLPSSITSTGSLTFFHPARKPKEADTATNCLSCSHEPDCIYSAKKIYIDRHLRKGNTGWPVKIVNPEIEDIFTSSGPEAAQEQLLEDLAEDYTSDTPKQEVEKRNWFGRCVWEAGNDVCDDQSVTITWEDDPLRKENGLGSRGAKTAQFHMTAFTQAQCERRGRVYGTLGEIAYDSTTITVYDFRTGTTTEFKPHQAGGGHGGGDEGLVRQFLRAVDAVDGGAMTGAEAQREFLGCDLDEAFRSHAAVFAAEEARTESKVVEWGSWWKEMVQGKM